MNRLFADRIQQWRQQVSLMRYRNRQRKHSRLMFKTHPGHISIVIKIPCRSWLGAYSWGDFHMAVALQKSLINEGFNVLLQVLPEWENPEGEQYDVVIVFRGLNRYNPKPNQLNMMWHISHPDAVSLEEYETFDHIFIASVPWTRHIRRQVRKPVECMLQCTDIEGFYLPENPPKHCNHRTLLFIGGTRDIFRKSIKYLLPTQHQLSVYGKNWRHFIDKKYIKGAYVPNEKLYQYYGSAGIVLNDHWDDMASKGFISNRIFDALACGAVIVSDNVTGMGKLESFMLTYEDKSSLKQCIAYVFENSTEVKAMARQGMRWVQQNHTFTHRAAQFSSLIHAHVEVVRNPGEHG